MAWILGYHATISQIGFSTGMTIVYGMIDPVAVVIIATAGSVALVITGLILARAYPTIAVAFLGRAWIDMLPVLDCDGARVAEAAGMPVAIVLLLAEVIVCAYGLKRAIARI